MIAATPSRDVRGTLRREGDALPAARIGTVPILWNNVDVVDLRRGTDAEQILDEIARIGYEGCQLGLGFPDGEALRRALDARGLRLAEVYASLPATGEGPEPEALAIGRDRLRLLHEGGGDVLCVALDLSAGRVERAGRASLPGTPVLSEAGWQRLADTLEALGRDAAGGGHALVFHPHAGTFVETPGEVERLVADTEPELVGLCLDVGHYLVGGGDPAAAMRRYGSRVRHIHLKDVDPKILDRLRTGELVDFREALRARIFTELGMGTLDLPAVIGALAENDYSGWLMVEQDSSWGPPSESAAIGRRVLAFALRSAG